MKQCFGKWKGCLGNAFISREFCTVKCLFNTWRMLFQTKIFFSFLLWLTFSFLPFLFRFKTIKKDLKKSIIQVGRFLNTLANSAASCCSYLCYFPFNYGLEIHDYLQLITNWSFEFPELLVAVLMGTFAMGVSEMALPFPGLCDKSLITCLCSCLRKASIYILNISNKWLKFLLCTICLCLFVLVHFPVIQQFSSASCLNEWNDCHSFCR